MEYDGTKAWVEAEIEASRLVRPIWDWLEKQPPEKQEKVTPILGELKDALMRSMLLPK
jgi:hypothetical protein